jgi:hypothetical protein
VARKAIFSLFFLMILSVSSGCALLDGLRETAGEFGATCSQDSECRSGLCHREGSQGFCTEACVNTCSRSGYECQDGVCAEPREPEGCSPACHDDAVCEALDGDFVCVCGTGFEGDGLSCVPVDSCLADNGGCGDETYFRCVGGVGQAPTCEAIDQCAEDNGGCGDETYFRCVDGPGQAPTCEAIDQCAEDNGGCGDPEFTRCLDGEGQEPTCRLIDACQVDNGGCGEERYFRCTDGSEAVPTCVATDLCAVDNGGCGDPRYFACAGGLGEEPSCELIDVCTIDNGGCGDSRVYTCVDGRGKSPLCRVEIEAIQNANVSSLSPDTALGGGTELIVDRDVREIYLEFDLSLLPRALAVTEVELAMTAFRGQDHGGDGTVFVYHVEDARWTEPMLTFNNRPMPQGDAVGSWQVPYAAGEVQTKRALTSTDELISVIQPLAEVALPVTFALRSPGYRTNYLTREANPATDRPRLTVTYDPLIDFCAVDNGGCGDPQRFQCVEGVEQKPTCVVRLEASENATVSSLQPQIALGPRTELVVDRTNSHVYLQFDLSEIPGDAVVTGVRLQMTAFRGFAHGGDGNVYTQFVPGDDWDENTITWLNAPAPRQTLLGFWWLWYNNQMRDQVGENDSPLLIPVVQGEVEGDKAISFRLISPGYRTNYRTRAFETMAQRPNLTIRFQLPDETVEE